MNGIHFWAKTEKDGSLGISVYQHMVNVGCVAQCIAEIRQDMLNYFQLRSSEVGALVALHDIGKISPGFQRKCKTWLKENNFTQFDSNANWEGEMEPDHGKISYAFLQAFFMKHGLSREESAYLSDVIASHHGTLMPLSDRIYKPRRHINESLSGIDWEKERINAATAVWDVFHADSTCLHFNENSSSYWWLAGLTSVADWIGSDERYFPSERDYVSHDAKSTASLALASIGYQPLQIKAGLSFFDIFEFQPNDMQKIAMDIITEPGIYIIEAPMGQGKTEAALGAAYQLMVNNQAKGIYFALPTQTTSNRIHIRIKDYVQKIDLQSPQTRLVHSNSWLLDDDGMPEIQKESGRDWFASSKRALIAPFGVGTIDQALLGILAAKHFFVRRFALSGKVVILDELHTYDLYTGTLINILIDELLKLRCTVIVLSATLTNKRREELLSSSDSSYSTKSRELLSYPLISGRRQGKPIEVAKAKPPELTRVSVKWIVADKAISLALDIVDKGGAVLWICDTVHSAQSTYLHLKEKVDINVKCALLHSRFPFWKRESLEEEWMQRLDKKGMHRCGCILVATQIVEQSIDIDADLLITELAPTDMLLQRMGRLWRHKRNWRPIDKPECYIIQEEKTLSELKTMDASIIKESLGGKAFVYAPYILLRSLNLWTTISEIVLPDDIRELLESTYKDMEEEPAAWSQLYDEWFGSDSAKKMHAMLNANIWQLSLDDEEGVQTRINEIQTVDVVLCTEHEANRYVFIDRTEITIDKYNNYLTIARAIHKNMVKVPEHCFSKKPDLDQNLKEYFPGKYVLGMVSLDGIVQIIGLKDIYGMRYSDELGLQIITRV